MTLEWQVEQSRTLTAAVHSQRYVEKQNHNASPVLVHDPSTAQARLCQQL